MVSSFLVSIITVVTRIVDRSYAVINMLCKSLLFCPDENVEHHVGAENPPPPTTANPEPLVEASQDTETPSTPPPELAAHSLVVATEAHPPLIKDEESTSSLLLAAASATPPPEAVNQVEAKVSDTVDAPIVPSESLAKKEAPVKTEELDSSSDEKATEKDEKEMEEVKKLEEDVASAKLEVTVEDALMVDPVTMAKEDTAAEQLATETSELPPSEQEPAAPQNQSATLNSEPETESTSVVTPELPLANGLPGESEELPDSSCSDTTALDKPDSANSQEPAPVASTVTQEEVVKEEIVKPSKDNPPSTVGSPTEESTTMQCKMELIYMCTSDT